MKLFVLSLTLLTSLSSFAGDMYLSCGLGKDNHWDNFQDSVLDQGRGLVTLKNGTMTYVVTFDGGTYWYIKSNSNLGGFEEKGPIQGDGTSFNIAHITDDLWCHIND